MRVPKLFDNEINVIMFFLGVVIALIGIIIEKWIF